MKKIWISKTIWVNIIAFVLIIVQTQTGWIMTPEIQGVLLTLVNLVLRAITKEEIKW